MKKHLLILAFFLFIAFSGIAQVIQVWGYVTNQNTGGPIANKQLAITAISDSGFFFTDTVYTAANGYYYDSVTFTDYPQDTANFLITLLDCNSNMAYGFGNSASLAVFNNFSICEHCDAIFTIVPDPIDPHAFTFVNTSISPMPTNIQWSFGDGSHSTTWSPTHTYSQPGPYQVELLLGYPYPSPCDDSIHHNLYVDPLSFKWDTINTCQGIVTASITGKNINKVTAFSMKTSFDPTVLTFQGMTYHHPEILSSNLTYTVGSNFLNIVWHNITPVSFGNDTLFSFEFNFLCGYTSLAWNPSCNVIDSTGYVPAAFINGFVDCCTKVEYMDPLSDHVSVFPNPVRDNVCFTEMVSNISIIDITGRTLKTENNTKEFSLENMKPGIYFIRYLHNGKSFTEKLVVDLSR